MYWVEQGDSRTALQDFEDNSADVIITDPPYELNFMGRTWDRSGVAFSVPMWTEALRVLKPGGHMAVFGHPRLFHRVTVAIEDAGFEIRDVLSWLYSSGFPKSHSVANSIDKLQGQPARGRAIPTASTHLPNGKYVDEKLTGNPVEEYQARTEDGANWIGWGTALKPAWEPIILARKPLEGTVAKNVLEYGTGAMNIEAARIPSTDGFEKAWDKPVSTNISAGSYVNPEERHTVDLTDYKPSGRWPANLLFDEEAAELLDEQSGVMRSVRNTRKKAGLSVGNGVTLNTFQIREDNVGGHNDSGGSSRFFYVSKASRSERNRGLEGFPLARGPVMSDRCINCGKGRMDGRRIGPCCDSPEYESTPARGNVANHHPTVKPVSLMRYLVRLLTPPDGVVFDPFTGSGSTGIGAVLEGFRFVGYDLDEDYVHIARTRIQHAIDDPEAWKATKTK